MSLKIEVKSYHDAAKAKRQAAAQRVVDEFGTELPDLRLLAFLDDEDWNYFRDQVGAGNRGLYTPIKSGNFRWDIWPHHVKKCMFVGDLSSLPLKQDVDHLIYLHGSTCANDVSLIMTFSHELQHFVQYGFHRKLWAENFLLQNLPKGVIDITGLNWPDIPAEREARIVAKRVAVKLCRADAVKQYIDLRIRESTTLKDIEDCNFHNKWTHQFLMIWLVKQSRSFSD